MLVDCLAEQGCERIFTVPGESFLAVLDGSCRTPIAGHATLADGMLSFRGLVLTPDGTGAESVEMRGAAADAERLGREAGRELRARLPAGWVAG